MLHSGTTQSSIMEDIGYPVTVIIQNVASLAVLQLRPTLNPVYFGFFCTITDGNLQIFVHILETCLNFVI